MKSFKIKFFSVGLAIALVSGCSLLPENKNREIIKQSIAEDQALTNAMRNKKSKYRHVFKQTDIFVPSYSRTELQKPSWWFAELGNVKGRQVPMDSAVQLILDGVPINIKYEDGIDSSKRITFKGSTVGEALDSIASASGYNFIIDKSNLIKWTKYETRVFNIAVIPGTESYGQGKKAGVDSGSDNSNIASEDEFASATGSFDPLEELVNELKTYSTFRNVIAKSQTGDEGVAEDEDEIPIFLNRSSSTITVRDKPHVIAQMEKIVQGKNILYRTQVIIDVDIITVRLNNENNAAYDLSLMLKNLGSNATQIVSGTALGDGAAFVDSISTGSNSWVGAIGPTEGKAAGSAVLVELLSSVGAVSTRMLPRAVAHHNTIAKLRDIDSIAYISERSAVQSVNAGTEFAIKQSRLDVGFSLYIIPSVFENDVNIRMATNLSHLIELVKNGDVITNEDGSSNTSYVESPHVQHRDFYSRFTVPNGNTFLISGLSSESKTIRENEAAAGLVGSAKQGKSERLETIIALTVRIQRPRNG